MSSFSASLFHHVKAWTTYEKLSGQTFVSKINVKSTDTSTSACKWRNILKVLEPATGVRNEMIFANTTRRAVLRSSKKCQWKSQKNRMHWPGIEPGPPAWQARILPLNHQCLHSCTYRFFSFILTFFGQDCRKAKATSTSKCL